MPAWKPVSRAEVGIETGFHAGVGRNDGVGRNADGNNLSKPASALVSESLLDRRPARISQRAFSKNPPTLENLCALTMWGTYIYVHTAGRGVVGEGKYTQLSQIEIEDGKYIRMLPLPSLLKD